MSYTPETTWANGLHPLGSNRVKSFINSGLSPRNMVIRYFELNKSGATASEIAKATNMEPCLAGQVAARMYRAGTLTFELCKRPGNKQLIRVYSPVSNP